MERQVITTDAAPLLADKEAFIITDANVDSRVIIPSGLFEGDRKLVLRAGDDNKTLDAAADIWRWLGENGAMRNSRVINFGGGMVTDLGGFAAATYMRGVSFVNIPTTLLAMVDGAVGGKTGFNFDGMKNRVGVFAPADEVVISCRWLSTLPREELLSGYGEMLKHALIQGEPLLGQTLEAIGTIPSEQLVLDNIAVKQRIVEADPKEQGLRAILNAGHTVGHAIEELALERGEPVAHGYAVAWGLVAEAALSAITTGESGAWLYDLAKVVKEWYGPMPVGCRDYDRLIKLMEGDKKNARPGAIAFSLIKRPGLPLDHPATVDAPTITAALDVARDLLS